MKSCGGLALFHIISLGRFICHSKKIITGKKLSVCCLRKVLGAAREGQVLCSCCPHRKHHLFHSTTLLHTWIPTCLAFLDVLVTSRVFLRIWSSILRTLNSTHLLFFWKISTILLDHINLPLPYQQKKLSDQYLLWQRNTNFNGHPSAVPQK